MLRRHFLKAPQQDRGRGRVLDGCITANGVQCQRWFIQQAFQKVRSGLILLIEQRPQGRLARGDTRGPIYPKEICRLLLPLYQAQGDDGFFTVKKIRRVWLRVSWLVRRAGIPARVTWLPGVRPHPHLPDILVVNTRIARVLPLQVLHLLGFRKQRWDGDVLMVSRRRFDVPPGQPVNVMPLAR